MRENNEGNDLNQRSLSAYMEMSQETFCAILNNNRKVKNNNEKRFKKEFTSVKGATDFLFLIISKVMFIV
jgi:hypothetical protein